MTQKERDRLVALKKAKKKLITQKQAAAEIGVSERQVRRMLRSLKERGDKAVVHAAHGRKSHRKIADPVRENVIGIVSQAVYQGFGPTLAAEYLAKKHDVEVSRETLRGWMVAAKLWRAKAKRVEKVHAWRTRRSRWGELLQWDTSEHDGLEGRGPKLYLISMIDDATSRMLARFVEHDSTEENLRLLQSYLERNGRPLSFYTDKAALFTNTPKTKRGELAGKDRSELPPTQIGRALKELDIEWIAAHSPQAKGRIERSFNTAQDRLVKGLRVAKAKTIEQANAYLDNEFLPWWNQTLTVVPAVADNAHRPLGKEHSLAASLSMSRPGGWQTITPFASKASCIRSSAPTFALVCGAAKCASKNVSMAGWRCGSGITIWLSPNVRLAPKPLPQNQPRRVRAKQSGARAIG
jgi:biotin operon repressor